MKLSYENLYLKSIDLENKLQGKKVISKIRGGRFKEYQKEVLTLAQAWKAKLANNEDPKVEFGGLQVLALKELREIVEILTSLLKIYDSLPNESKKVVREKVEIILTGTTYILDEGDNTEARNFQFEFRLAAKLAEAGYAISFFENPDILVGVNNRKYAIECKRITGSSTRTIQSNIETAVDQLISHKEDYYAGIVALDISALLDKRTDLLKGESREATQNRVLDDLQIKLFSDYKRIQKLKKYSHSHLVALMYNFSGSYIVENINEVGWAQGTTILQFNKENPIKAKRFNEDFTSYRDGGKEVN